MTITQRFRTWLAKAAVRVSGLAFIPPWLRYSFQTYAFRDLVNEGYKGMATVNACARILATTFSEPSLNAYRDQDGKEVAVPNHPIRQLMRRPNPDMGEAEFYTFCVTYAAIGGNAYLWKDRDNGTNVTRLWPFHDGDVTPIPGRNSQEGIVHYYVLDVGDYSGATNPWGIARHDDLSGVAIPKSEIIHWKWMPDPLQPWRGIGALEAAAQDIGTANEIRSYIYSLLKNDAKPPVVINLMEGEAFDEEVNERLRAQWSQRYGGANRGLPAFLPHGMTVKELGFNLQQLEIDSLRDGPDASICMGFGIQPAIVGALVGLKHSGIQANFEEARRILTEMTLVPLWRSFASEFNQAMEGERGFTAAETVRFDLSGIAALQQNVGELWTRVQAAWDSGIVTRAEARQLLGMPASPADEVYKVGLATQLLPAGSAQVPDGGAKRLPSPPPTANGNGTYMLEPGRADRVIAAARRKTVKRTNGRKAAPDPGRFFDYGYASRIKENWPEIWAAGGNERGNEVFELWTRYRDGERTEAIEYWIETERPAWGARHHENFRLAGVVAQIKWGWVGSRGADYMRGVINEEIERLSEKDGDFYDDPANTYLDYKEFPPDDGGASDRRAPGELYERQRTAVGRLRQVRESLLGDAEAAVQAYFDDFGERAEAAVRQYEEKRVSVPAGPLAGTGLKALSADDWEQLLLLIIGQDDAPALGGIISSIMLNVFSASWPVWGAMLESEAQFDENDPLVSEFLQTAGQRVRNITDSTRDQLRTYLDYGYRNGWAIEDLVKGTSERPGIRSFIQETYRNRAQAIARTEIGDAQAGASAARYAAMGVTQVVIFDNGFPNSHPTCTQLDGTVQTVEWYKNNRLQHPNCVRAAGPYYED